MIAKTTTTTHFAQMLSQARAATGAPSVLKSSATSSRGRELTPSHVRTL
jgi:hypothetical protein